MPAQTPIAGSRDDSVMGDKRCVMAVFASVGNGDTYITGMSVIRSLSVDSGNAATIQAGATVSGGTVTFQTTGTATNVQLVAYGY